MFALLAMLIHICAGGIPFHSTPSKHRLITATASHYLFHAPPPQGRRPSLHICALFRQLGEDGPDAHSRAEEALQRSQKPDP